MREFALTKLVTPDGVQLERPPPSPLEAVAAAGQSTTTAPASADEDESTDADDKREAALERSWNEHWLRLGASSGAGVPRYPGHDKAARLLARLG